MDLLHYFAPVEPNVEYAPNQMGSKLKLMVSEEDLEEVDVVLMMYKRIVIQIIPVAPKQGMKSESIYISYIKATIS